MVPEIAVETKLPETLAVPVTVLPDPSVNVRSIVPVNVSSKVQVVYPGNVLEIGPLPLNDPLYVETGWVVEVVGGEVVVVVEVVDVVGGNVVVVVVIGAVVVVVVGLGGETPAGFIENFTFVPPALTAIFLVCDR
mgnify:CR=1 FL=1